MNYAAQTTDPATFEIVKNSLYKIAEEMRVVLAKTAYSPLLKSAGDYSCGVFDARGEMVAQGPDLPIHLGSMPDAVRAVVGAVAAAVHDGDVFLHNDPSLGGAQLAATLRATERLKALAQRYGSAELIGIMAQVMDYAERLMRATLMDLPDGEGIFEDFCDGDGIADDETGADARFRIRLSVKK